MTMTRCGSEGSRGSRPYSLVTQKYRTFLPVSRGSRSSQATHNPSCKMGSLFEARLIQVGLGPAQMRMLWLQYHREAPVTVPEGMPDRCNRFPGRND